MSYHFYPEIIISVSSEVITMSDAILKVEDMTKTFGPVTALSDVSLTVCPGEIRGLIGENGSGKSTVTSIVAGMQKADKGKMTFKGKEWKPESMIDALHNGIGMIVQESGTIPGISVAENIFLGKTEQFKRSFGMIDRKAMNDRATEVMKNIGVNDVTGSMPMASLDFQARKLVEIAKVIMEKPEILVIDETSTALSQDGREILYSVMNKFREENKSVIFISHDLDEIMEVCDTLTVLRDGQIIRTFDKDEFDASAIRAAMIGREMKGDYYRSDFIPSAKEEAALEIKNLTYKDRVKNLSLTLKKGEIVGIGGLAHCGMHSLGKLCFGDLKPDSGSVTVSDGTEITSPETAMKENIGYVSKDRDVESLCLSASIEDNISIAGMNRFAISNFLVTKSREKKYVDEQISSLSIKCSGRDQLVSQLSGGNKQKVVFGKWIGCGSEILILDCPTRGVDIGVKQAMYQLMVKLKNEGKSILMISEELPELIGMSDRVVIMKDGEITAQFERSKDLSDSQIIEYMI